MADDQEQDAVDFAAGGPADVHATAMSGFPQGYHQVSLLVLGPTKLSPNVPDPIRPFHWYVVLDLTNLKVLANETSANSRNVPPSIQQYLGQAQRFLFFFTNCATGSWFPQGDVYDFLKKVGSGPQLARAEQIVEAFSYTVFPKFSYILAATTNIGDRPGFEAFSDLNNAYLTMRFIPIVDKDRQVIGSAPVQP